MPYCSLIIPTRDRAASLKRMLDSVLRQDDLSGFELIVVDNGSSDDTRETCASFSHLPNTYIFDDTPGSLTGRHRGFQQSNGEILCFLDDDIELDSGWLRTVKEVFLSRPDIDLLTGPSLPVFAGDPPQWLEDFWYQPTGGGRFCSWLSLIDMGSASREIDPNLVWSLNFCIRRRIFEDLKGFHPDLYGPGLEMFQGDGETGLTMKAINAGNKALYHPGALVHHHIPSSRLTGEYFGRRAFFQGIADSFSSLRRGEPSRSLLQKWLDSWRLMLRPRKYSNKEVREIRLLTERKYREGYGFHQAWFRKSAVVRNWVMKSDYLDYRIPRMDQ